MRRPFLLALGSLLLALSLSTAARAEPRSLALDPATTEITFLLGATGLFALHHTHQKIAAGLAELDATEQRTLLALRTRAAFKTQVQEWKNILLRSRDAKDFATYRARFETEETLVREGLTRLASPAHPSADTKDLVAEHVRLGEAYRAALAAFDPAQPEAPFNADAAVRGLDRPLADEPEPPIVTATLRPGA